jgi:hypothetical protein
MKNKILLGILGLSTVLSSCTITKREHLKGYHVEWNKKEKQVQTLSNKPNSESVNPTSIPEKVQEASSQEIPSFATTSAEIDLAPRTATEVFSGKNEDPSNTREVESSSPKSLKQIAQEIKAKKKNFKKPAADADEVLNTVFSFVSFGLGILSLVFSVWAIVGMVMTIVTGLFATGGVPALMALLFGLSAFIIALIFAKRGADSGKFSAFLKMGKLFGLIGMIVGAVTLIMTIIFAVIF